MAFDNTDNTGRNGEPKTLLDLVRDLTMSGAKLPPIFGQIVQFQGQWIQGSQALVDVLGKIGKSLLASTTTLVGAMFGSTRATNQLRQALVKLADKRDQKVADEFTEKNQGADRDAFIEARKAYRNTPGSPADKKDARQKHKDARDELGDVLKKINEKSRKKASAASKKVYKSKLELYRKRGLTDDVAKRMARKKAKKVYDVAFRTAKHATPNVQRASAAASKALKAGQAAATASRTAATVSGGANFARAASTSLVGGAVGGAATLGLGFLIQGGILSGMDAWDKWKIKQEGAMKKELEHQTLRNKLQITGIQQASQLRQAAFKAEEEMDRKRFENLRILAESKTKMNEADLAMQERLQNIEKQRLAAQKEVEILRQKVGQAKETRQHYDTYVQQEAQVRDSAGFQTGFNEAFLNTFSFGLRRRSIVDERGNEVDDSVRTAVRDKGWFKRDQQRALTSILSTAKMAREASMAAVKADFDEFVTAYESFAETISSSTVGAMAPEIAARINKIKEDSEKWMKNSSENQVTMAAGELYSHSFEENVQAGRIKYDNETKNYVYQNEEGITIAIKDADEFNDDRSREGAQAAAIAKQRAEEEQKRIEEERKLAEKLHSYQQAQVALVQEQVKKQEELLKNLRDSAAKNYESDITGLFGAGNRKTGAEFREIMQNRADDMRRDAVLASRRFAGNAQAAEEYKLQSDISSAGTRAQRKLRSDEQKERLEHYKKGQTELFALHQKNIMEEHTLAMQNNTKIFQAYIEAAKQQRDAYFRMLDKQLSMEVSASTTFGRAQTDVVQEQQLNLISRKFDEIKTNFESSFNIQKAASDAEFDEAVRADESQFKEKQLKERNALEDSYIKEKYKLERELAVEEHKFRVELIKEEYAYKRSMDQAEKDRDRNNISEMDRIASTADKAKLDELAGLNFNGKTYAELTREERGELFSSIATQQNARVNEALEYVGKKKEDYTDERGNQLEGDALREAITKDLLSAFDKLAADQKTGALGQRYMQVAEGLGNSIENQVMESDDRSERHAQAINEGIGAKIDELGNKFIASTQNISRRATENEIHHTNQKAKLENDQQLETNTRTERINQLRAGREAEWDNFKQQTQKRLELRQKEEEEGFKIGVRQIARRETAATNAFTERLGATSGGQWSSAALKEQNEQRFNNALDDLEDRHAAERKQALDNGASDTDMMKLRARQELEMKDLENQKKVSDTMLQRRIGSETGNTSDAMSMWEQIQQSAFAHIENPTVSAIDSLREQSKEQMDTMLKAQLDQITPLNEEVALSAQIAMNTAMMVQEARKGKGEGAPSVNNTIVAPQGLVENKDAMPSWKEVREYSKSRIKF